MLGQFVVALGKYFALNNLIEEFEEEEKSQLFNLSVKSVTLVGKNY